MFPGPFVTQPTNYIYNTNRRVLKVMILGEVEEILEVVDAKNFKTIAAPLFQQLSKSIVSPHFQVSLLYFVRENFTSTV